MFTYEQLVEILENFVEVDQIKSEDNFKLDLGLSSFDTVCVIAEIKSIHGVEVKATDFIKYKTVGEMSDYISSISK